MKRPTHVKIIASNPKNGQASIAFLIGKSYEVETFDNETGEATVISDDSRFNGKIILNRSEYKPV